MKITADIPKVGDKGYYSCGSDAYPVTVTKVSKSGFKITVRQEKFVGDSENGHDYFGIQVWKFEENPKGQEITFYWQPSQEDWFDETCRLNITGKWFARQDPSF